jgi:hypothetical protein
MMDILDGLEKKLNKKLNDEEIDLFYKYDDAKDEANELLSYESFKQGFRASVLLMIEVMQN